LYLKKERKKKHFDSSVRNPIPQDPPLTNEQRQMISHDTKNELVARSWRRYEAQNSKKQPSVLISESNEGGLQASVVGTAGKGRTLVSSCHLKVEKEHLFFFS
jgi:hypothetical protein